MADVWLYVDDEPLDITGDTTIPLTRQVQNIGDLDAKLGSFSRSFTVPATDRNQRLLDNSFTFQAATRLPYRSTDARLVIDGMELGVGKLIIENDGLSPTEIRLTFYLDNGPFFQLANATNLHDVPMGLGEHLYTNAAIFNSADLAGSPNQGGDGNTMYIYPCIDYTGEAQWFPSTTITSGVYLNRLFPASFTRYTLASIEEALGYTFTGEIFDPKTGDLAEPQYLIDGVPTDLLSDLIWPFSGSKFTRDTNYRGRNTYELYAVAPALTVNNTNLKLTETLPSGLPNGYRVGGGILPVTATPGPGEYWLLQQPQTADRSDIRVTIYGTATFGAAPAAAFTPSASGLTSNATDLLGEFTSVVSGAVYQPTPGTLNFSGSGMPAGVYTFWLAFTLKCDAHRSWRVLYNSNGTAIVTTNLVTNVQWLRDRGTTEQEREISFTYPDNVRVWSATTEYEEGDLVTYTGNVYQCVVGWQLGNIPGINAGWFLWSPPNYPPRRATRAWVSGTTGLPNVTVAAWLKTLAQLFGCIILVDESRRQVEFFQFKKLYQNIGQAKDWTAKLANPQAVKWSTRSNLYGQASTLRFMNEEAEGTIMGSQTFSVDDTTLPATKDVVQLPIASSDDWQRWEQVTITPDIYTAPLIRRLNTAGEFAGSGTAKQRLLYLNRVADVLGDMSYFKRDGTVYNQRSQNVPLAYFGVVPGSTPNRALGYENLWPVHWYWLQFITNPLRELNATVVLDASDVYQLDFRVPVYLEPFGAYFYIQKLSDWVPGRPCTVELIKL